MSMVIHGIRTITLGKPTRFRTNPMALQLIPKGSRKLKDWIHKYITHLDFVLGVNFENSLLNPFKASAEKIIVFVLEHNTIRNLWFSWYLKPLLVVSIPSD